MINTDYSTSLLTFKRKQMRWLHDRHREANEKWMFLSWRESWRGWWFWL